MPELLTPPPPSRFPPRPTPNRPPPMRRRSDDPDPDRERSIWIVPAVAAMFFALSLLAMLLLPDVLSPTTRNALLFITAAALNISIVSPFMHLIIEQRWALKGPERRRARWYRGL